MGIGNTRGKCDWYVEVVYNEVEPRGHASDVAEAVRGDSMSRTNQVCLFSCYLLVSSWMMPWTYSMGVQTATIVVLILTPSRRFNHSIGAI